MVKKEIKEKLLSKLDDVNHKFYYDVLDGECHEDSIGMDSTHLFRALRYVPIKVIQKWIKEIKDQLK